MASVVGSTHKKQKAKDDIISKLPDSLISHILSCLPTKDAVRTSVLSKRWIDCWTLINKLKLDDSVLYYSRMRKKSSEKQQHFINFVYKTLLLIRSYSMESVSLFITKKYNATLVNAWISCILNRRPKKIHICKKEFAFSVSSHTSDQLFNHTYSLEELVLEMYRCAIKVPPSRDGYFSFGNLKLIKLCEIRFTIDESLVIRLSVLKKFQIKNCCWLSAHDVTIEAPLLESVLIDQDRWSVFCKPYSCTIKFTASCVKEFTYCGDGGISQPIVLSNSSAARNASVNIILRGFNSNYVQENESCTFILLKEFSEVKCIKFHASKGLTPPNVALLPKFAMLSHLDLGFVSVEVLLGLLQKSSVLNTLLFKGISKFDQELLNSVVVPDCLTSTLQVVKFENVGGSEHELFLAKYFMENGIVLEKMGFSLANAELSKSKVIEEFKEKLYSFKKGVSFAILEFYY